MYRIILTLLLLRPHALCSGFKDPSFNLPPDPNKKIILLVTSFRTGSTFLGEIFNNNPHVQYIFEPFYDPSITKMARNGELIGSGPRHTDSDLKMLYLQQILHNCTLYPSSFPERYERCGAPGENLARFNTTECVQQHYVRGAVYQELCRRRHVTVLKLIRLDKLSDLLKIRQIRAADLRIIHLTRHPTPVMMSRRAGGLFYMWRDKGRMVESGYQHYTSWRAKVAWEMYNYCQNSINNVRFVGKDKWLQERYMLLTHRQMSLNPIETAELIYDFIEEDLPEGVVEHLRDITEGKSRGYETRSDSALETHRNSSELIDKWKNLGLWGKFYNVPLVESHCRGLFEELGLGFSVDSFSVRKLKSVMADFDDVDFNFNNFLINPRPY